MRFLIAFIAIIIMPNAANAQSLNVMTFNIRLDLAADSLNTWAYRKENLTSQILFHEADLVGVQEALPHQMKDIAERLTGFKSTGEGREGKQKGEYSAIFYNTIRLDILDSATFWLSLTPTVAGSKSWDAAITRIVSWAKFRDKKTNKIFYMFNTHFDHIGKIARKESALMLLHAIDSISGKLTAIVTGDFNATPADEPIQIITNKSNPIKLTDTKEVSVAKHYGPTGTFTGFGPKEINDDPIDYIFFNHGVKVLKHATFSQSWRGRFSSDHFPVWCQLIIE